MARNFRNTGLIRSPRSKRQTGWDLSVSSTSFVTIAANTKVALAVFNSAALAEVGPGTIVRTRGLLAVKTDQISAAEAQIGAFGIGFVNSVAGQLGVTALPGPSTEITWDGWFVLQPILQNFAFGTAVGFDPDHAVQYPIDSKAMRKYDVDENLAVMVQNDAATGFDIAIYIRFLVKFG